MTRLLLVFLALALTSCASISREPLTAAELRNPRSPGIEGARYWADTAPANISELIEEIEQQRRASGLSGDNVTLSLSGGAENGAFAAGILNAWSDAGTRPEFLNVLGVSTGALAAPFAFLGSDYDDELRRVYGGLPPEKLFARRTIFGILPNASLFSSDPLYRLIEEYITDEFLARIAAEHRRGRRLLIQTVSLDAQRPVLWDLGRIAASGAPNAAKVFRDALVASASMPGVFPPVLIEVESASGIRDELHVDGGVISQSAFVPGWRIPRRMSGHPTLYAIRNGRVAPEPQITGARITTVAARSLATLIKEQGTNDLRVAYELGRSQGGTYRATWIGTDFNHPLDEPFDPAYMQALFNYGYERFKSGTLWSDQPPR